MFVVKGMMRREGVTKMARQAIVLVMSVLLGCFPSVGREEQEADADTDVDTDTDTDSFTAQR
jgi:hypothetical protein